MNNHFRLKYFDDPDISYKQKHDNINRNYTPAIFFGDGYILDKSEKDITYSNIEIKISFILFLRTINKTSIIKDKI